MRNAQKTRELTLQSQELTRKTHVQAVETRQAQLFMGLYGTIRSIEFRIPYYEFLYDWEWKDYEDFTQKYGRESNLEAYTKFSSVGMYFEGVGVLLKRD